MVIVCVLTREREGVDLNGIGRREDLPGVVGEGESYSEYCISLFSKNRKITVEIYFSIKIRKKKSIIFLLLAC